MHNTESDEIRGLGLGDIHHVGLVVKDVDRALSTYSALLGGAGTSRFEFQTPDVPMRWGKRQQNLRVGFVSLGGTLLEILEPLDDQSPHGKFLAEHGEGLHHLGFLVSDLDEQTARLAELGMAKLAGTNEPQDPLRWVYLDGPDVGGAVIEMMEKSPSSEKLWADVTSAMIANA
ncbi:methylmalonyl-CoA epimerase [Lentzea xinjiangensis]|uniref:Methylmalonyl-CoA epimerase n=1 Tax=Lentzea xinjiangensis TaxID=402600 RepID=A0A1H9V0N7_9PSEU|nr:VOC family protein [Lentzea xinjiangensis]SES15131.1 methylmalonyl-CoA epimerase [Lentzea xinjiangensis]